MCAFKEGMAGPSSDSQIGRKVWRKYPTQDSFRFQGSNDKH